MRRLPCLETASAALLCVALASCGSKEKVDAAAAAPPSTQVVQEPDLNLVKVDRPERFTVITAGQHEELPEIHATGIVTPDIQKSIPVISLASGRVVAIYAKLGDDVHKGQLLLQVLSNDISNAFQTYEQAKADEQLARKQLDRAQLLFSHGAISLNDLQVAEDAEQKSKVALRIAAQLIKTLGGDIDTPNPVVNIYAPMDGTIVEQNIVNTGVVSQTNLFTIANLSTIWVVCNIYENDLPNVRLGDTADVRLNAYADRAFHGRISNIGKVLDATIRTAPVRIVLQNPGMMRSGMFVTATLFGRHGRTLASVPGSAVLHLHDRDWVFVPAGSSQFRRTEITSGNVVNGNQDVLAGLSPGQQVVKNALALSSEGDQ